MFTQLQQANRHKKFAISEHLQYFITFVHRDLVSSGDLAIEFIIELLSPCNDRQADIVTTSTALHTANEFLHSSIDRRWRWLETLGLVRYAKLLTQLQPTAANIACVAQFFSYPSAVKFPQLMGTDLARLDLERVNFIRANLTGANLSGCNFRDADLLFANFSRANLSGADLRGATLNETMWQGAIVSGCNFRESIGLTPVQVRDLRSRGGIFD